MIARLAQAGEENSILRKKQAEHMNDLNKKVKQVNELKERNRELM